MNYLPFQSTCVNLHVLVAIVLFDPVFYVVFCRSLFVVVSFFSWPLFVLHRFTTSDYHFGIFKLFVSELIQKISCLRTTKCPVDGRGKYNIKTILFSEISPPKLCLIRPKTTDPPLVTDNFVTRLELTTLAMRSILIGFNIVQIW